MSLPNTCLSSCSVNDSIDALKLHRNMSQGQKSYMPKIINFIDLTSLKIKIKIHWFEFASQIYSQPQEFAASGPRDKR